MMLWEAEESAGKVWDGPLVPGRTQTRVICLMDSVC